MEIDPNNTDVFQLLDKLKKANGTYPPELLALRRQGYLRQVAEISGGAGLALALKTTAKSAAKSAALPPAASSVLEGILVVAIVAEAGAVTYFYRDRIADLYRSITGSPKIEQVASPPVLPSPVPGIQITFTPDVTVTETATVVGTPSPFVAEQATQSGTNQESQSSPNTSQGGSPAVSTPAANDNKDNGNHYGNTPIPERTKQPGNNNNDTSTNSDQTKPKKKP